MSRREPKKRKYTKEYLDELAVKLTEWSKVETNYWLGDFCFRNGFNRSRLAELAQGHDGFAAALELAKQNQENKLFKLGLNKKFNTSMAIFALKNVAGWRDAQDITSNNEKIMGGMVVTVVHKKQE